jgi:hypothetical protein
MFSNLRMERFKKWTFLLETSIILFALKNSEAFEVSVQITPEIVVETISDNGEYPIQTESISIDPKKLKVEKLKQNLSDQLNKIPEKDFEVSAIEPLLYNSHKKYQNQLGQFFLRNQNFHGKLN